MVPEEFNVDIIGEIDRLTDGQYELYTVSPVVRELKNLSNGSDKAAQAASVGMLFIEKDKVEVLESDIQHADDAILEEAIKTKRSIVATNDRELKKRCLNNSIPIIYLRSKNHLESKGVNIYDDN